jgi:DNA repair exonuclease SbcCD ATPase subunit
MPDAQDSRDLHPFGEERDDARWMTYAELGQARGINTASAKRLAARRKWRRQPGNDGTARVAVPVGEAMLRTGKTHSAREDIARLVSNLEAALTTLQEQLERERGRADQAADAAERSAVRLEAAEGQIARLRAAAETAVLVQDALERALTAKERSMRQLEGEAAAERAARAEAEADAATLRQAEMVRQGLSRAARLRAAWRATAPGRTAR